VIRRRIKGYTSRFCPTRNSGSFNGIAALRFAPVRNPDALVQRRRRHAECAAAAARAGRQPGDAGADEGDLPDGDPRAGNVGRTLDSDSAGSARNLSSVASVAAGACDPQAGEDARYAGQDLLQERRRFASRFAQAEYRRRAGVLQQAGRHQAHHHRDRGRPMGVLDGAGRPDVRPRSARVHGQGQLRPEAVPPLDDADVGRRSLCQSVEHDRDRAQRARRRSEQSGLARPGDLGSRRRSGVARRHQLRARFGAQPCRAAPDDHRPGSEEAVRDGRRLARRDFRPVRRRLVVRRHGLPVSSPTTPPAAAMASRCGWWPSNRRRARR
jgi:hypothetical protein